MEARGAWTLLGVLLVAGCMSSPLPSLSDLPSSQQGQGGQEVPSSGASPPVPTAPNQPPPMSGDPVSLKEALPLADSKAKKWAADAVLGMARAHERTGGYQDDRLTWPSDFEPGDGRATMWVLTYESEEKNATLRIQVYADGKVSSGAPRNGWTNLPMASWSVDSTEALRTARTHSNFSRILEENDKVVSIGLATYEMSFETNVYKPRWSARVQADAGDSIVLVDARTGVIEKIEDRR